MREAPCKDCCQRHEGCHDICPSFKEYKLDKEILSEKMNEKREFEDYLVQAILRMKGVRTI